MTSSKQEIAIIGGGAAGFFAAITAAENYPQHRVTIYEKGTKLLAKVRVSGGGRCNVTHACFDVRQLVKNYPRGEKQLISAFSQFNPTDTIQWFEEKGVELKTEGDGRMFPVTDRSETIVNCLMHEADRLRINVITNAELVSFLKNNDENFELTFRDGSVVPADKIVLAAGGHPKAENLNWLKDTGHELVLPVPSLFTFNIPLDPLVELMGVSVSPTELKIAGTKHIVRGPLLITHWGMSGPAVLKLSSMAARELAEKKYEFDLTVNWIPEYHADQLQQLMPSFKKELASKQMVNHCPFVLPKRLWLFLLTKSSIPLTQRWADLSKDQVRKLIGNLMNDCYQVRGKTTFKEEFVTCGGVNLNEVEFKTMESKKCKGLFFAGEVMDIDAFTGGYNFQAAWTTGYIAGLNIGN